jgi:hypothetical protein
MAASPTLPGVSAGNSYQNVQTQGISPWAQGYVGDVLGKTQAVTSDLNAPTYGGQRVAQLSGLEQQGLGGIAGLKGYTPQGQSFTNQGVMQQYMSPYEQGVTDIATRDARKQADIETTRRNANAVSAGAFGGTRRDILDAEAEKNTAQLLNDIRTRGLQSAYASGMGQFNAEEARRQQENQFGYTSGIGALDKQMQYGALPRTVEQQGLDVGYQDFLRQQQYPYQQLQFQKEMLSGLPLSAASTEMNYAPPSTASQVLGGALAGLGAAGNIGRSSNPYENLFNGIGGLFGNSSPTMNYSNPSSWDVSNLSMGIPSIGSGSNYFSGFGSSLPGALSYRGFGV